MAYTDHETSTTWESQVSGVCKDCGNGTLHNGINPAFEMLSSDGLDEEELRCIRCGSTHVDCLMF